ncbi:MAG: multiheme c-type cytochrome [Mariprofundaceae bacterium]
MKWVSVLAVIAVALFLIVQNMNAPVPSQAISAETVADLGLPKDYWDQPAATKGDAPSSWHALEKNLNPESCAQCHREQFDGWKKSLHAVAYSPGLIGQFPGMGHGAGNNCLNCHAPLSEQKYIDHADMQQSLVLKLENPKGFDADANLAAKKLPLRHTGVSCAVCHVRGWQRFGPPQRKTGAVGKVKGPAHDGFTATKAFEQSEFCASCHQFPPSYAINGKPLENTVFEWKQSRFARENTHCQTCHMPNRKHEFRGIHDIEMTRKGLDFELKNIESTTVLSMTSTWIGHAFPTYVTPKVIVVAEALGGKGVVLKEKQWEIIREVFYNDGWKEKRDTRLMPGETRLFTMDKLPEGSEEVRFRVHVIPDYFYKGVYRDLMAGSLDDTSSKHIQQALKQADANDYLLYENSVLIK